MEPVKLGPWFKPVKFEAPYAEKVPGDRVSGFKFALNPFNRSFKVRDIDNSVDVCRVQLDIT